MILSRPKTTAIFFRKGLLIRAVEALRPDRCHEMQADFSRKAHCHCNYLLAAIGENVIGLNLTIQGQYPAPLKPTNPRLVIGETPLRVIEFCPFCGRSVRLTLPKYRLIEILPN